MNKPRKLLIVEDCKEVLDLLIEVYARRGYDVTGAENGLDALQKLKAMDPLPSLILLDLTMPKMDGFTFRQEQEKDSEFNKIPVVVITGDINAEAQAIRCGARGHLQKPVSIKTLLQTADKFCSGPSENSHHA